MNVPARRGRRRIQKPSQSLSRKPGPKSSTRFLADGGTVRQHVRRECAEHQPAVACGNGTAGHAPHAAEPVQVVHRDHLHDGRWVGADGQAVHGEGRWHTLRATIGGRGRGVDDATDGRGRRRPNDRHRGHGQTSGGVRLRANDQVLRCAGGRPCPSPQASLSCPPGPAGASTALLFFSAACVDRTDLRSFVRLVAAGRRAMGSSTVRRPRRG